VRFEGRVAFITGGSRGVGRAVALALAREGCDVVVAAKTTAPDPRLPGTIGTVAAEIEALGRAALPVRVDVRDEEAIAAAVQAAVERFGRIDFLVNNAGALHWQPLTETPLKRFDLVLGVNARGAYACTYHVLPHMLRQGYGHILMMSPPLDPTGIGAAGKVAYAISKYGMTLIAHGLAEEVRGRNVACNALWPATMVESYATINFALGDRSLWRTADVLADAVVQIFAQEPRRCTGQALIDEEVLRAAGVSDFARYRCDPAVEPPRLSFDFKVAAGPR
jgi:citronellol/citronellal dehydrogenase